MILYTDIGCQNCEYDLTWNYNFLSTRQYESVDKSTYGNYSLEVYNSDGSFNYSEVYKTWYKTGSYPWEVQGVSQYYCENGVITPMTEALHNTLPNNEFITYYYHGIEAEGARRFIE